MFENLEKGNACLASGRLTEAIDWYRMSLDEHPGHIATLNNLANTLQAAGRFSESNQIYISLLRQAKKPLAWRIASNYLAGLHYQREYGPAVLKEIAAALGTQFGIPDKLIKPENQGAVLKVGFISPDLCDHPVGFFLLPLLRNLRRSRVHPVLYATGGRSDSTSIVLKSLAEWHDVATLEHEPLLERLRSDGLDMLVDLSGHTAGNRLPVFARRAAPIQISWLGYFGTTGIPAMDYVLMDPFHAPPHAEDFFTEQVMRLPYSRFCYEPVAFAPEVADPPFITNRYVTFGSFNNTAKYNEGVFSLWAKILHSVEKSRLILKWRTFTDARYREYVWQAFESFGISRDRVELREASVHRVVLEEYAEIDIALDPFPFCGGYTSCEALWMGVPVVTLPMDRTVSRQTYCFLLSMGLSDLVARDDLDYVRIASGLARNENILRILRETLRGRMRASELLNATSFASEFENTLVEIHRRHTQRSK